MQQPTPGTIFTELLQTGHPQAAAWVTGDNVSPQLSGMVKFYQTPYGGVLVAAEVFGLPNISVPRSTDFYGFHIHENGDCSASFAHTGDHYNPSGAEHPNHAGDLLPLFGNQGYAWLVFYDKRFSIEEIIGKSVVIHSLRDDFTSQPAGNAGTKIGCGVIRQLS